MSWARRRSRKGCSATSVSSSAISSAGRPSARSASIRRSSAARRNSSSPGSPAERTTISEISECWSPPQRQRLPQLRGGDRRLGTIRLADQPLEPVHVELIPVETQHITRRLGEDRTAALAERFSQLRDAHLQGGPAGPRRLLAPQLVDQLIARHDLVRAQQQDRQQRALLRTRERDHGVAIGDLERTEDPEFHFVSC